MYIHVLHSKILRSARTLYLCVFCGSQNKQRLLLYSALTDGFYSRDEVCLLRGTKWVFKLSRSENKQRLVPLTA